MKFLLVTVFLDMFGLGLIVPIMPALMTEVAAGPAAAVLWSGVLGSVYGVLQFAVSPLLGRIADRCGRRPVLLASLGCLGVDWFAHAAASGPWTLLAFHALAGACAGTNTVVNAYVADVTGPAGRARAYGLLSAAFSVGFVAGPVLGGLLGSVDVRLPFLAAGLLCFANVAYGWLILPESRPGDGVTPVTLRTVNPFGAIRAVLRRPVLGRLTYARLCADIARMICQSVWTFFLAVQFGWSTTRIGTVMAVAALAGAAFQTWATGPIVRVLGDRRAAVTGSLIGVAALAGIAASATPWMLHTWQAVGVAGSFAGAAAQSWISRTVAATEQGTVQGALTSVGALAEACVPVTAGIVLGSLIRYGHPHLIFAGAALFAGAATVLLATTREPAGRDPVRRPERR